MYYNYNTIILCSYIVLHKYGASVVSRIEVYTTYILARKRHLVSGSYCNTIILRIIQ